MGGVGVRGRDGGWGGWGLGGGKVDGGVGVRGREGGCVSKLKTCYFFHF